MPTGYVYELYSDEGTETYIGSTTRTIEIRLKAHYNRLNEYEQNRRKYFDDVFYLIRQYTNIKTRILEEVEYIDEDDTLLRQEEQKWIDMSKTCVNTRRAFTPEEDYYDYRNEVMRNWRNKNKEYDRVRQKEYNNSVEDVKCECGKALSRRNYLRHRLSLKHQKWVSLQNN
jgi:hypothetical protein